MSNDKEQFKFYSWKDIDRYVKLNKKEWDKGINAITAYPSAVTLYLKDENTSSAEEIIEKKLFPKNTFRENESLMIRLDLGSNEYIPVIYDYSDDWEKNVFSPLFNSVLYHDTAYPERNQNIQPDLTTPVIAFHSYKGGVGRTLSLLAFSKAWTFTFEKENPKLLIIDSDIEAPGLTWLYQSSNKVIFSYLDLLTLLQDSDDIDRIVSLAHSKIVAQLITVEALDRKVEHFFLPAYRYKEQMLDVYAKPETILNGIDREYILATVLSKLGKKLNSSAVLVDLRAGFSDYSSTLLFDSRVKKYIVTSTSTQSLMGTKLTLEYLLKGLKIEEDTVLPEIFLNLIPRTLADSERTSITSDLLSFYDASTSGESKIDFISDVLTELYHDDSLIHLTDMNHIFDLLDNKLYNTIVKLVLRDYSNKKVEKPIGSNEEILKKINEFADKQMVAENNSQLNLLMTEPIENLRNKFNSESSAAIIMGAKGSGKTFLFRELIRNKNWSDFCKALDGNKEGGNFKEVMVCLPILAPKNLSKMQAVLKECIDYYNDQFSFENIPPSICFDNAHKINAYIDKCQNKNEWLEFWEELIATSIGGFSSFKDANEALLKENKYVVVIFDGIDEILSRPADNDSQRNAIAVLCQDIVNSLSFSYPMIKAVIFLRKDLAKDSIQVNYEQFLQTNKDVELKWTNAEALKLAVWLVDQANPGFYKGKGKDKVKINDASSRVINEQLIKLWGEKLGRPKSKEAYSSRWILAALSDFNGQLQARDLVRFLKYATQNPSKDLYDDRIIAPAQVREAVALSSMEKIREVEQEIAKLAPIFEKLRSLPSEFKRLPFSKEKSELTLEEENTMKQEGYLAIEDGKYYIPEILRFTLDFKYEKGARPKVLAFMLKNSTDNYIL